MYCHGAIHVMYHVSSVFHGNNKNNNCVIDRYAISQDSELQSLGRHPVNAGTRYGHWTTRIVCFQAGRMSRLEQQIPQVRLCAQPGCCLSCGFSSVECQEGWQ